ncbi:hypothetical protein AAHE18_18G073000 [Arachis hypogaea]
MSSVTVALVNLIWSLVFSKISHSLTFPRVDAIFLPNLVVLQCSGYD